MKRYLCLFLSFAVFLSLLAGCSAAPKPYVPSGNDLANDAGTTKPPPTDPDAPEQELTLAYYAEKPLNPLKSADFTKNLRIVQKILKNKVYLVKYFLVWEEQTFMQMLYLMFTKITLEREYLQEKVFMM